MTTTAMSLDALRAGLTDGQRSILDDVWLCMKQSRAGLSERHLLDKYGRDVIQGETRALGGSVIYSGYEENRLRYRLGLVGMFLTSDGPRLESLVGKYLVILAALYADNPELERISSKDLEQRTIFSALELNELRLILSTSNGSFASRNGGWSADEWFVLVGDEIVDLKRALNMEQYVKSEIMKAYDATAPVGEAARMTRLLPPAPHDSLDDLLSKRDLCPDKDMGDIDLTFMNDEALKEILTADWNEIKDIFHAKAWKSCVIMCGSFLEGLLLWKLEDASLGVGKEITQRRRLEDLGLSDLLDLCNERRLLSIETKHLTEWTRLYRNVVHPGNQRRKIRAVSREHATIAVNLIALVARSFHEREGRTK